MIFARQLTERLEQLGANAWRGIVFRHTFADYPPDAENTRGARWNPPEVPAIYTSLSRAVALAEAEYQIALQPVRPRAKRTLWRISVVLDQVLDLSDRRTLAEFGIGDAELSSVSYAVCQHVGGAVEWLDHDGLLVPSARAAEGTNLVIFPNKRKGGYEFNVLDCEVIDTGRA